jgi:hypothetical protein
MPPPVEVQGRPALPGRVWEGAAPLPSGRRPAVRSGVKGGGLHPPYQPRGHLRVTRVGWLMRCQGAANGGKGDVKKKDTPEAPGVEGGVKGTPS